MQNQKFGRFTETVSVLWLVFYGLLTALHFSKLMTALPGKFNFSFTFLLLGGTILFAATSAGRAQPSLRDGALAAVIGGFLLFTMTRTLSPGLVSSFAVGSVLLLMGTWLTAALGREVVSSTYIWPLLIVVTCFDLWSVFSSHGITQQIVLSGDSPKEILNLLVLEVPIPAIGLSPILGIGDVLFLGFIAGAVEQLQLEWRRYFIGTMLGFGACLVTLLILEIPVPALVFIAPAIGLSLGRSVLTTAREVLMAIGFVASLLVVRSLL